MSRGRASREADRSMEQTACLVPSPVWSSLFVVLSGCRSEMYDQPRYEPYEATRFL